MNHKNNYPTPSSQLTMFECEAPYPTPQPVAKGTHTSRPVIAKPDTNANREGYKLTKLGWIPEDWSVKRLVDVATIQTGIQKGAKVEGDKVKMPYLRVANVQDGHLDLSEIKHIEVPLAKISRYLLREDDILMTEGGDFDKLGRGTIWHSEISKCLHQNHVFAVRVSGDRLLPYFLNAFASSEKGKKYFISCSKQSTNLASINSTQLKNLPVPIPSIPEQRAIADCLSTWYRAIQTLTQLIAQRELRKKWLMQQLLTGKKRLPGFGGEWKLLRIRDFANEVSNNNSSDEDIIVLSCTKYDGLVPSLEYFGRKIYSDNLHTYKIVPKNHFAYATNHIEEGSIGYQNEYEKGLVSPMYTVFKTDNSVKDDLLYRVLKSHNLIHEYNKRMEGSIDRRGGLRWKTFSGIKIKLPPLEEQTAIAQVLQRADQEITLLNQKLTHLQDQKKGLMQQLLTGKKRLTLNNE